MFNEECQEARASNSAESASRQEVSQFAMVVMSVYILSLLTTAGLSMSPLLIALC